MNICANKQPGKTRLPCIIAVIFLATSGLQSCSNQSNTGKNTGKQLSSPAGEIHSGANLKIYKDPGTGKFGTPPAGAQASLSSAALNNRKSTVSVMREAPSPVTGGGIMVNLKGKFRKNLMATKDVRGKITITDTARAAGTSEKGN